MPLLANPTEPGFTEVTDTLEEQKKTFDSAFEVLREAQANNRPFLLQIIHDEDIVMSGNCSIDQMIAISKLVLHEAFMAAKHRLSGKK